MKASLQKQMEKELEEINNEFHQVIEEKKHCYERMSPSEQEHCDCEIFYNRWVDTKNKYKKLDEE